MNATLVNKTKLTKQGQITIPLKARKIFNIETDEDLYIYEVGGAMVILKDSIENLIKSDRIKQTFDVEKKIEEENEYLLSIKELTEDDFI
ncbi:MAG: AbrB/MazE/SpoVT family DNA-binding domain-containing protein [Methanosarcinales archaeon]